MILGGGESGYGSAILAKEKGFDVFLSDRGALDPKYRDELLKWEIPFEEGEHTEELILNADLIIKSPGIPDKAPMVKAAKERGIPIISEIEFAGRYCKGRTICITGSNGKTTTTTLIYNILRDAGYDVALGGNIGESFAYSVATASHQWYVLELSSFQLDGMFDFKADIAILMNITPDHLDRYDYKMENYVKSKFRVIQNQDNSSTFIYSDDDELIAQQMGEVKIDINMLPFSVKHPLKRGAHINNTTICVNTEGKRFTMDISELGIQGKHNLYNAMASIEAALTAGVSEESIKESLRNFRGVEHRVEKVGEILGVEYINDSKATNVDSVWYALESMTKPVVWIAGGTDKGNDYNYLKDVAMGRVKALVCMGVDNDKLVDFFTPLLPQVYNTHSLEEAMAKAAECAKEGDVVLLSPACASFDLFKNYQHRGDEFKNWVYRHSKESIH